LCPADLRPDIIHCYGEDHVTPFATRSQIAGQHLMERHAGLIMSTLAKGFSEAGWEPKDLP
jgi:hypothetical protein